MVRCTAVSLALSACAFATSLATAGASLTVSTKHELAIARPSEMVSVPWSAVVKALPEARIDRLIVRDPKGASLPYQVMKGADGAGFTDLLFQYDYRAGERTATFSVQASAAVVPPFPARTFARFVPERLDDFAWENDRVAHRAYGPALAAPRSAGSNKEVLVASGIDVWSKRVAYPVIDRWYHGGAYHADGGEGLDHYKTGTSRGAGGSGVWVNGKLYTSGNFARWTILANGPVRTVFELSYDKWLAGAFFVSEVKRFTVDAGQQLDMVDSTFQFDTPGPVTVALGLTRNSADKTEAGSSALVDLTPRGVLAQWETRRTLGGLGTAVLLTGPAAGRASDASNELLLATITSGKPLRYFAGAAWSGSGHIADQHAWRAYLVQAAARAASPLTITTTITTIAP